MCAMDNSRVVRIRSTTASSSRTSIGTWSLMCRVLPTRFLLVLLCAVALVGCLRPYFHSVFDPPDAHFPGITSEWKAGSANDVRVLFVHGICTHTEANWIATGWDVVIPGYFKSVTVTEKPLPNVGQVKLIDREHGIGANTISGRFIIWSPLTADDKAKLNFDNPPAYKVAPGQFTWTRASLNSTLKSQLLNDCLSDAVIYAGYRGAEIQTALQRRVGWNHG
jgi:hypothetical protein